MRFHREYTHCDSWCYRLDLWHKSLQFHCSKLHTYYSATIPVLSYSRNHPVIIYTVLPYNTRLKFENPVFIILYTIAEFIKVTF